MSLVGPRPHATSAKAAGRLYEEAVDAYAARHRVKPGITGWAQVNGWRGETDTLEKIERRVECDLFYIEHWSLALDLKILLRTAFVVLGDRRSEEHTSELKSLMRISYAVFCLKKNTNQQT